jgi:two-component system, cell cycle response regulator DivK
MHKGDAMSASQFTVLLVDDDQDTQNIFKMVMEHSQLPLDICSDAESALMYLQNHQPDVIVLDIMLPGIDGYQALDQIRGRSLAPECRLIATTMYYTAETPDDVLKRGFDGYLQKPLKPATLVADLQRFSAEI